MRWTTVGLAAVVFAAIVGQAVPGGGETGINDEGFITNWLMLAPIRLEDNQSGADAVGKQQLKDEAKLQPKAGDKVKVDGKELVWKAYKAKDHFFDFNDLLGAQTEDSVGYAVSYINAPSDLKGVKLQIGSDDQAVVYLNGKEIIKNATARALEKDQDSAEVALNKGVNVLVIKVVNEKVDWSGCARFVTNNNTPVKGLRATITPNK